MINTLIDAGPMIALFDRDDKFHIPVKQCLSEYRGHLLSTWPVITETSHMLDFSIPVQINYLKWIYREAVQIFDLKQEHLKRIIEMTEKYGDIPMDLADASLMVTAEITNIRHIMTIDSDYYIYRTKDRQHIENILEPYMR